MRMSEDQERVLQSAAQWWKKKKEKVFAVAGLAGTGKTTVVKKIVSSLPCQRVVYAAFTGMAAQVLSRKTGESAMTLHQFLYTPKLVNVRGRTKLIFVEKPVSAFKEIDLLVVDEASMVSSKIWESIMQTEVRIMIVGDHGQLPPVGEVSEAYKLLQTTKNKLEKIHRQAEGSPVVDLAHKVRNGSAGSALSTQGGKVAAVLPRNKISLQQMLAADQILVGTNKTAESINKRIRTHKGHEGAFDVGDKVIVTKNHWSVVTSKTGTPALNGTICVVEEVVEEEARLVMKPLFCKEGDVFDVELKARTGDIDPKDLKYGWAITVHKAQGSEWKKVLVYDESRFFNREEDNRKEWLYTAITRASEKLIIAK